MLVHHALLSNQISSPFLRAFTPPLTIGVGYSQILPLNDSSMSTHSFQNKQQRLGIVDFQTHATSKLERA